MKIESHAITRQQDKVNPVVCKQKKKVLANILKTLFILDRT